MKLTREEQSTHDLAVKVGKQQRASDSAAIKVLIDVDKSKLYKKLEMRSLFTYAVEYMGMDEAIAFASIAVARKCAEVPALIQAIDQQKISVFRANRIVAALTRENAAELIAFATTHTARETDRETARRNPRAAHKDRIKFISEDEVEITITISKATFDQLKRAQSLLAQKGKKAGLGEAVTVCTEYFVNAHDPVKKAERAQKKSEPRKLCLNRVKKRQPLTAMQKHAVNLRDQGRCTHVNEQGVRCNSDRWTQVHHILEVSRGGANDPENLTTLCSFHHDLVHQLTMPIEGQFSWLR